MSTAETAEIIHALEYLDIAPSTGCVIESTPNQLQITLPEYRPLTDPLLSGIASVRGVASATPNGDRQIIVRTR